MAWNREERQRIALTDKYFGTPLTAEMVAAYIANCPKPPEVTITATLPPKWVNPRPGPCTCGYCRGIITHSRHDKPTYNPFLVMQRESEYEAAEA